MMFRSYSKISEYFLRDYVAIAAIPYNEAEVYSLSITNPNGRQCSHLIGLFTRV